MRTIFLYVLCALSLSFIAYQWHKEQVSRIYVMAFADGIAAAPKSNLDKQCVAWLFETNIKSARQRVCGKSK